MTDLPDAETCTCGHPEDSHDIGHEGQPHYCVTVGGCPCTAYREPEPAATDLPDEQHKDWCSAVGPNCRCLQIPDPSMTDLPDAETCTCGHPKSTHGPGPKIATPIFCQGSSTCTCVIFTAATKSTDLPDAETAWEKWRTRFGQYTIEGDHRESFLAGFAAASGPWAEQLDAANARAEDWHESAEHRLNEGMRFRAERDAALARNAELEADLAESEKGWAAIHREMADELRESNQREYALQAELDNLRGRLTAPLSDDEKDRILNADSRSHMLTRVWQIIVARAAIVRGSDDEAGEDE